ncbi:MAG: endolytic transglycosylase MltG [Candidatus Staskawiczbacteria bacterium]|nr:endolytic transglycosylase MltG [Candidatus Staskawiczbacteria bacterium]
MKIKLRFFKKFIPIASTILLLGLILFSWEVYFPVNSNSAENIEFLVQKGEGDEEIAVRLKKQGIIKNNYFFNIYAIIFGNDSKLQAGKYSLSLAMTIPEIIKKFVSGDVIKQKITIVEGWDIKDIEKYFVDEKISSLEDFREALKKDYSGEFSFLKEKPSNVGIEGYLFPDTYNISLGTKADDVVRLMLSNFNKKLNDGLRQQIVSQNKTIFEVITMASIIEKEVKTMDDKKIVSGILWKRLDVGMPLQVDATINYITNKNDSGATIKDTKIDSPYNTYKYKGLPKGPISNPGMDSILAAIYPTKTKYWYYLSGFDGQTIFSETFAEHNMAVLKYLK